MLDVFGVPERMPVLGSSVKLGTPEGSEPAVTANVCGAVPPIAEIVTLQETPGCPVGRVGGFTVMRGQSVTQTVTVLVSNVTAPFRARTRPETLALVFRVMLVSARMLPASVVPVPRVAELPTCQNTGLQFEPPLMT